MRFAIVVALVAGISLMAEEAKTDGKTKVVQTPFGPSWRAADADAKGPKRRVVKDDPTLKIEESGDTVTFKRQTPFGEQVWRRKRSELSDIEKEMIAARNQALAPSKAAPAAGGSSADANKK